MKHHPRILAISTILCLFLLPGGTGCRSLISRVLPRRRPHLVEVARSEWQWTGIAVSRKGRIVVSFPRWSARVPMAVGEVLSGGKVVPFPDAEWNSWSPGISGADHFVCVQSVVFDAADHLWILDPANPQFKGVVPGGAKLLKFDFAGRRLLQAIRFDAAAAPPASYLNDVRIDLAHGYAYITDSGLGALLAVNLETGRVRRLLENHTSTRWENIVLNVGGSDWHRADGTIPQVHADGIAYDAKNDALYYQALCGRSLYRIAAGWLRDEHLPAAELAAKVEKLGSPGAADGLEFGTDGVLCRTDIENDAISRFYPDGRSDLLLQDRRLAWPDSLAITPAGWLYVTTSQIHRGAKVLEPYRLFKVKLPENR